ncbi:MAG: TetR/AcrR family transcriptional regulator [Planctomycetota bacterium]
MRAQQREETRDQIVGAALTALSELGFDGASTRTIAELANVSQGLLTYHFKSKDELWQAAANHLFALHDDWMDRATLKRGTVEPRVRQREFVRRLVHFHARHPEFARFIATYGRTDDARSKWLAETHLVRTYQRVADVLEDTPAEDLPHAFYVLAGASGSLFSAGNECKLVTGVNPRSRAAVKRHADYLANLLVPEE